MIDVILVSDMVLKVHIIVDGCHNIFYSNMLRNEITDILADRSLDIIKIAVLSKYL